MNVQLRIDDYLECIWAKRLQFSAVVYVDEMTVVIDLTQQSRFILQMEKWLLNGKDGDLALS